MISFCDVLPYMYLRNFKVYLQYEFDSLFYVVGIQNRMSNDYLHDYSLAVFWSLGYILMSPNPHISHINQGQHVTTTANHRKLGYIWIGICTPTFCDLFN